MSRSTAKAALRLRRALRALHTVALLLAAGLSAFLFNFVCSPAPGHEPKAQAASVVPDDRAVVLNASAVPNDRAAVPSASTRVAEPVATKSARTEHRQANPSAIVAHNERASALGRQIFFDASLSEPAGTSCASCHDPARAYSGNHGSKLGVARGSRPDHYARRNTPSLLYLKFVRKFHFHWEEDAPFADAVGGFFWDGRADSLADLVRQPLLHPDEMGNESAEQVARKVRASAFADELSAEYDVRWEDPDAVLRQLGRALEAFLTSDALAPFASKYDDYLRGRATLTAQEREGLKLFRNGEKGGCDACHKLNDASPNPERSLFTDFGYEALAVPRNRKLPVNADATRYDLGLCEPDARHFPMEREQWCGSFRTPSLRNVAVRESFMHNGAFSELRDVVEFYATRGVKPKRWYKHGAEFDDVPEQFRSQISLERVPYDRRAGQQPRLDDREIDAIVAFLKTLTDNTRD